MMTPNCIQYLNETNVSVSEGKNVRHLCSRATHHHGARITETLGSKKHVSAVVVTTAEGNCLLSFFIFAGKNVMRQWFKHVDVNIPPANASETWVSGKN